MRHPLRYLLTAVFLDNVRGMSCVKLCRKIFPLLIHGVSCRFEGISHECCPWDARRKPPGDSYVYGRAAERTRKPEAKESGKRRRDEKWKKKWRDGFLLGPLGTYSVERVALCRLYTVPSLFSFSSANGRLFRPVAIRDGDTHFPSFASPLSILLARLLLFVPRGSEFLFHQTILPNGRIRFLSAFRASRPTLAGNRSLGQLDLQRG